MNDSQTGFSSGDNVSSELRNVSKPGRIALRQELEALLQSDCDPESEITRRELVARLRRFRAAGLETAQRLLRSHPRRGRSCAFAISALHDDILSELYRFVDRHVFCGAGAKETDRLCVAAVGGYGRKFLAPGSDLDLLFLHPSGPASRSETSVEYMLHTLWDMGLTVGHATRTPQGCLLAAKDPAICTALLDARLLSGDALLFADWRSAFLEQIRASDCADFIDSKLAERDKRHRRFGASRYLVEPNIKESKGGLRDLDVLYWLAKYVYRLGRQSEMVRSDLFDRGDYAQFLACLSFLWAVRCELHFWSRRAEDRLTFEAQLHLAESWGYTEKNGLRAVERFMKRYFTVARRSGQLTRILCAALEESGKKRLPLLPAAHRRNVAMLPGRQIGADFVVESGRLNAVDDSVFARDGVNFLRVFFLRSAFRAALHPHVVTLLSRELHRIDSKLRRNGEANRYFLACLLEPDAAGILREMNEMGVLGRFIREFGKIVSLMQFGMYHCYTVDEHTLHALEELRNLEKGEHIQELPLASSLIHPTRNRAALSLAVLLHDIAKGSGQDHSIAGERIAKKLAARFGLSSAEGETTAWLVRNHLIMNHFAQKRDIHDEKTIKDFVGQVGTSERLRLLLLLTVADTRAVGPGVWNGWKGTLLRRLYHAAEAHLTGHVPDLSVEEGIRHKQRLLAQQLSHWSKIHIQRHIERFTPDYWSAFDPPEHKRHAEMIAEVEGVPEAIRTNSCLRMVSDKFRSATEMVCYQPDRAGLFASITGACAVANVSIVDARISTTRDGMALEVLRLRESALDEEGIGTFLGRHRIRALRKRIEMVLKETVLRPIPAKNRRMPGRFSRKAFAIAGKVRIDNEASRQRSVIEISALDRPGLLHSLAWALFDLNLEVVSAHVTTYGERAEDVFYVCEQDGGKISSRARHRVVRERLLRALRP